MFQIALAALFLPSLIQGTKVLNSLGSRHLVFTVGLRGKQSQLVPTGQMQTPHASNSWSWNYFLLRGFTYNLLSLLLTAVVDRQSSETRERQPLERLCVDGYTHTCTDNS